ncbi:hypothetical protein RRU94_00125 [Domibacillus sp. DTU_2020_1001157_1_SI_ALB_TIR_016]|uniref:hypothetical protein n=1 Tax=Domibacillus sp. DTU_2020_1001157_1_SI_ALB_TIR_016 TaxID=3077789 RepID=UPI0028EF55CC|nr:hypothetical protein [Domibacillus sp. DTU_2020_1001157_1_SI_ALB_TIR_016]WNS78418.1 hypothetical protein RRU94_00125 [Domibacillus sp. DTU_2020_1001157_1_SI_ALB_TIR_016]
MNNETYVDFCFIRNEQGRFKEDINALLHDLFSTKRLHWYLEEKKIDTAEMVIAEIKGMSDWTSEGDLLHYLEEKADERFWTYVQGCQLYIYPFQKGCASCGTH